MNETQITERAMMVEKDSLEVSEAPTNSQQIAQSRFNGREKGFRKEFLDITKLVRSVQSAEGNPDCFRKAEGYCDRLDCAWYRYCVGGDHARPGEKT